MNPQYYSSRELAVYRKFRIDRSVVLDNRFLNTVDAVGIENIYVADADKIREGMVGIDQHGWLMFFFKEATESIFTFVCAEIRLNQSGELVACGECVSTLVVDKPEMMDFKLNSVPFMIPVGCVAEIRDAIWRGYA